MRKNIFSASNFRTILFGLAAITVISVTASCSKDSDEEIVSGDITIGSANLTSSSNLGSQETGANTEDILANSTFNSQVAIAFNGNSVSVTNNVSGVTYTQNGANLVVTSTASGVDFVVSGTTTNGSLKIYSGSKFKLTLNGTNITSTDGPAINIQSGKRAFVVLAAGTTNSLTDGTTYSTQYASDGTEEDAKGTFFSEGELLFSGTGSLTVAGNYKQAIASDDYVRISEGNITITKAASHGIKTNDGVFIDGGTINITATKDGIQSEDSPIIVNAGTINITAGDDGISATFEDETDTSNIESIFVNINGGTITINAVEEGIEGKGYVTVNDGTINITSGDDAINAGKGLYFNGGKTYAYATGNDALDTNGKLGITGGIIIAVGGASAPETSVDAVAEDSSYESGFTITGGYLIGIGRGNTPDTPLTTSSQKTVMLGSLSGSANQIINFTSESGTEAFTFKTPIAYSHIMVSNSKIANGTYRIYTGGSVTGGEEFNGVYTSGTYSGGTSSTQITVSGQVTTSGASNRPGGGRP